MKIGILTRKEDAWCSSRLKEAFRGRGVSVKCLSIRKLVANVGLLSSVLIDEIDLVKEIQALLIRPIGRGSLDETIFRLNILHTLKRIGLPLVNSPASIEKAADKYHTLSIMANNGIPIPRTVATESVSEAVKAFHEFGGDAIVKPIFGSQGIGVARISNEDVAERAFRTLRFNRHVLYIQEFVQHGQRDIRLFVIGGRVVAGMYRVSTSWKTNVSRGAKPVHLSFSEKMKELAIRTADAIGCEIAGVDLMESPNGLLVCEINSQPGWRGLQSIAKVNIADEIADYLIRKAKR